MKNILLTGLLAVSALVSHAQNPVLVKDIDTAKFSSSAPKNLTAFNNRLYFVADVKRWNGFGMVGNRELWSTNGTAASTAIVADLNINAGGNNGSFPVGLKVWKNKLYFFASGMDGKQNLFETDGTESGTKQITTTGLSVYVTSGRYPDALVEFNNELYFVGNDMVNGYELWKTDGTAAGTVMVKEINPSKGMFDTDSKISQLTVMGNHLYFFANETSDEDSTQLWKTNGTTAGTVKIVSYEIDNDETAYSLTATSNHIYYTYKRSLYKSDGTTAGTTLFMADNSPEHLTSFNGELLFQTTTSGNNIPTMAHICITSNDPQGYTVLKDVAPNAINVSANSIYYHPMNVVDGKLYFTVSITGPSTELWQTDGTLNGTSLIRTYLSSEGAIANQQFIKHNNEIYFTTRLNGKDYLNKTNGTSAGTSVLSTVGVNGVNNLTSVDNVLFFTSDDQTPGMFGEEVWKFGNDSTTGGGGSTGVFEKQNNQQSVNVYPNPAKNIVNIELNNGSSVISITLFDITGRQIETVELTGNRINHNISQLDTGKYFYSIRTIEGLIIKKLLISR